MAMARSWSKVVPISPDTHQSVVRMPSTRDGHGSFMVEDGIHSTCIASGYPSATISGNNTLLLPFLPMLDSCLYVPSFLAQVLSPDLFLPENIGPLRS